MSTGTAQQRARQAAGRLTERGLLISCVVCVGLGFLMMASADQPGRPDFAAVDPRWLLIYGSSLLCVHVALVISRVPSDQILFAAAALLSGLGLLAQYRMGTFHSDDSSRLILYVFPAGIALMLMTALGFRDGRYKVLASRPWLWGVASLALITALLAVGQRFRGAFYAGGLVTPTELLKITVILFVAGFINRRAKPLGHWGHWQLVPPLRCLLPLFVFWVLLAGLLLLQRDLGMFVILAVTLLIMLSIGTGKAGYIVYGVLGAGLLGYLALKTVSHVQRRLEAWQSPFLDPTGSSWQILQGLAGLYAGGLWGEGFGQGDPHLTPIAKSDFIYAVIGEELGFIGCSAVVVCYLVFIYRGLRIAARARSFFGLLLSTGLTTVFAIQTFLNIGGVTKLIPLTGLTLPFISHGGSSLLTCFVSAGLLLAISGDESAGPGGGGQGLRQRKKAHPGPNAASRIPGASRRDSKAPTTRRGVVR